VYLVAGQARSAAIALDSVGLPGRPMKLFVPRRKRPALRHPSPALGRPVGCKAGLRPNGPIARLYKAVFSSTARPSRVVPAVLDLLVSQIWKSGSLVCPLRGLFLPLGLGFRVTSFRSRVLNGGVDLIHSSRVVEQSAHPAPIGS